MSTNELSNSAVSSEVLEEKINNFLNQNKLKPQPTKNNIRINLFDFKLKDVSDSIKKEISSTYEKLGWGKIYFYGTYHFDAFFISLGGPCDFKLTSDGGGC
jgi:hypothetical protein